MHHLEKCGIPRTIGSLKNCFWRYFESVSQRATAKQFDTVVHPSIITGADDALILDHLPPPELHLLTRPVTTLFAGLVSLWPNAHTLLKACNVECESYHGLSFTGNDARHLLKNVDMLQSMCPLECLKYVRAFRAFERVVTSCFSNDLSPSARENVTSFHDAFMDLSIKVLRKFTQCSIT